MELRNNTITLKELLDHPGARAVLRRRFGKWLDHPMVRAAGTLTLDQLTAMAGACLPRSVIQDTLRELKSL